MIDALAPLRRLPRVRLGHLPTPLEPMPRLAMHLGLHALWVKRDDCTGLGLGGSKVPKLEWRRRLVWIHTGGGPGIFAYPATMSRLSAVP